MLVYLDQNYASRIAKYLRGQAAHDAFGVVFEALMRTSPLVPASSFHVLETRGGYLLPTIQGLFGMLSQGCWVRPYPEAVELQASRQGIDRRDLLTRNGHWRASARLQPLEGLLDLELTGPQVRRRTKVREFAARRLGVSADLSQRLPFFDLLGRTVAFRSTDVEREGQDSDLADLVMAATVAPYVDALATDRYLAEILRRVGYAKPLFSGRKPDVYRFASWLAQYERST